MSGKIGTLFEDSAKTTPLYPRTKLSAVSDQYGNSLENNVVYLTNTGPEASAGLDASSLQGSTLSEILDMAFAGMDTDNILADVTPTKSPGTGLNYTATQDCIVVSSNHDWDNGRSVDRRANINGVRLSAATGDWGFNTFGPWIVPLKKGQTYHMSTDNGSVGIWYRVFALKR